MVLELLDVPGQLVSVLEPISETYQAEVTDSENNTIAKYHTLKEAIDAAESGQKAKLLRPIYINAFEGTNSVSAGKDIIVDFAGNYMRYYPDEFIENNGTVQIVDSSEGKDAIIRFSKRFLTNYGDATVDLNDIISTQIGTSSEYNIIFYNDTTGTLRVNNTKVDAREGYTTLIHNKGILRADGLNINNPYRNTKAIVNDAAQDVEINATILLTAYDGYAFNENTYVIDNINGGKVIIKGGRYQSNKYVFANDNSKFIMEKGETVSCNHVKPIFNRNNAIFTLEDGVLHGNVYNDSSSKIYQYG